MEMTRRVLTNVAAPEAQKAPVGQFARLREYPTPANKEVTAPNADTLYTLAWLDVSKEPWVLSLPDMQDRYFLMPMLSGWTDVFQVPGTRTTGTKAQTYAITGPNWKGTLPPGVTEYKSPTGMVWILGRIYCTGTPADYQGGAQNPGPMPTGAAQRLRQALYSAAGQGGPQHRYEDPGAGPGERHGRRRLLQAPGDPLEG